jgi:hypothetical protein
VDNSDRNAKRTVTMLSHPSRTSLALKELTATEEAKIGALVKRAVI